MNSKDVEIKENFAKRVFYNIFLLLFICSISSGLLGIVYEKTKTRIEEEKNRSGIIAMKEVLPEATRFVEDKNFSRGYDKNENFVGWVIKTFSDGYGGKIEILFGLNIEKKITGIKILSHSETPGLGDRITDNSFLSQFLQKSISEIDLKCDGGSIDAITGATISSRAVINGIKSIEGLNE